MNKHWGSQVNASGDREADVSNDWDDNCNGSYTWYTTNDNSGTGGSKKIDGTSSANFSSWGGYSCNDFSVSPTGTATKLCTTGKHDQSDNYTNTEPSANSTWNSVAKTLNISTSVVDTERTDWMKDNYYKDSLEISPFLSDVDNVRYGLAINTSNGINTKSDNYVRPLVKAKIIEIYKSYLTTYYNTLLDSEPTDTNQELGDLARDTFQQYYTAYFGDSWKPFNRIVIIDGDISPQSEYSVNYDITMPAGMHIKNPNAFSITIATHNEKRDYRCYTEWKDCSVPASCEFSSAEITNFVTDSDKKKVSVLKDINYDCKVTSTVSTCNKLETLKNCVDFNLTRDSLAYDDEDFSAEFFEGIGKTVAFNESIKIFGGQELICEDGVFTNFSWVTDPMFLAQMAMSLYAMDVGGVQGYVSSATDWMTGVTDATETVAETAEKVTEVAEIANTTGSVASNVEVAEAVADGAEAIETLSEAQETAQLLKDIGSYANEARLGFEIGIEGAGLIEDYKDSQNNAGKVKSNDCSKSFAKCLTDLGFTPSSLVTNMLNTSDNGNLEQIMQNFDNAELLCVDDTKTYAAPDGTNCLIWANEYQKGKAAIIEQNEFAALYEEEIDMGEEVAKAGASVAVSALSYVNPLLGMTANILLKAGQSFEDCNQCDEAKCASEQIPLEAIQLFKLTNGKNTNAKREGSHYGLGAGFVAYNNCFFKKRVKVGPVYDESSRHAEHFCCYNSQLSRILIGQMYQQFGYTFASNGCAAMELEDLQRVNFSSCAPDTIPSPSNQCINFEEMKDYLASQINWDTQKSFDMNTAINTMLNATSGME